MKYRGYYIAVILLFYALSSIADDRALLIGIGTYKSDTGWKRINGDADVSLLKPQFEKQGFVVATLVNEKATKQNITEALTQLKKECQPGDRVYFHFSGHGQPMTDANGDEENGYDEAMVPYDAGRFYRKGKYEGENHLIDDEYNQLLTAIKQKLMATGQLFVAIDACYSRGMERGSNDDEIEDIDILHSARGTNESFEFDKEIPIAIADKPLPKSLHVGAKLTVVSACKENERNYEYKTSAGKMYGSLSYYIYELLKTDTDFTRWTLHFHEEAYRKLRIFQTCQHPSVVVYE